MKTLKKYPLKEYLSVEQQGLTSKCMHSEKYNHSKESKEQKHLNECMVLWQHWKVFTDMGISDSEGKKVLSNKCRETEKSPDQRRNCRHCKTY